MRKFQFAGGVLERPVQAERVLGAHLPFTGKQTQGAHGDRLEAAVAKASEMQAAVSAGGSEAEAALSAQVASAEEEARGKQKQLDAASQSCSACTG